MKSLFIKGGLRSARGDLLRLEVYPVVFMKREALIKRNEGFLTETQGTRRVGQYR